jgi:hypothetical protein
MRMRWKLVGLAGVAGVAATGGVIARRRRAQRDYDPDELRARLHSRLEESSAEGAVGAPDCSADSLGRPAESPSARSARDQ